MAAEKIERIADPDREKRVEAFARAVEETMVRQRGAFDLEQTLNALEVPAGDDPLIAARVYEFAARRAWADSRITSKERKVLEWIRSVLKLDARAVRDIEGDIARTAFYRYFQTAIADGVLDVQEVRILNHVAHQLDTTLRTLVLQDFRQEAAAFLGEQLTMVIHLGTPSKEAWQQLLSNAEALDLRDDDMLTLLQPRAERLVDRVIFSGVTAQSLGEEHDSTLNWLLKHLKISDNCRQRAKAQIRELRSLALRGRPLVGKLPAHQAQFFGPGTTLDLGRGVVSDAMTYAVADYCDGLRDASLIVGSLPVSKPGTVPSEDLPYWPSYEQCSPSQRACYLDWLIDGRRDPHIAIGYVFIYFYGLERRILLDRQDIAAVVEELVRLRHVYGSSRSVRNYSTALIFLAILMDSEEMTIPRKLILTAIVETRRWSEDGLTACLAYLHGSRTALPADLALGIAESDPQSSHSVVIKRHSAIFRELFRKKYQNAFGDGILLRASKRTNSFSYHAASGTLLQDASTIEIGNIPNVLGIKKQFKPVLAMWEDCVRELKSYDRTIRSAATEDLTAEKYEALPEELRQGDHPEFDLWWDSKTQHADENGWTILPVSELAHIKNIVKRTTLTRKQSLSLVATAGALGLAIEPDVRLTCKNYKWDEVVAVFMPEDGKEGDPAIYRAAATLLQLGFSIAEADGVIDKAELDHITQHLDEQFALTDSQSARLQRLSYLLQRTRSNASSVGKHLQKTLSLEQRRRVGEFLVGIAATDQVITTDELAALEKAYRLIGLESFELDSLLADYGEETTIADDTVLIQEQRQSRRTGEPIPTPSVAATRPRFKLDMAAVTRIMSETKEVAEILKNAMSVDEEYDAFQSTGERGGGLREQPTIITDQPTAEVALMESTAVVADASLDQRFHIFMEILTTRQTWSHKELKSVARRHNLMLAGAIEAINEWSQEKYGDWLVEQGNPLTVRLDLLQDEQ